MKRRGFLGKLGGLAAVPLFVRVREDRELVEKPIVSGVGMSDKKPDSGKEGWLKVKTPSGVRYLRLFGSVD